MLKKKRGQPTKYKDEYCEMLVEHMNKGLSFESFAGLIGVTKETIFNWLEKNKQFFDSKKKGEVRCRLFWERLGIAGSSGKLKNFNCGTWIFNMKNRFAWKDRQEIDQNSNINVNYKLATEKDRPKDDDE